ncbi:MAG: hypothetical protein IPI67_04265 [Myxococcales bacterium]|nr:hypothetical protein [Myxococcales bacterium]
MTARHRSSLFGALAAAVLTLSICAPSHAQSETAQERAAAHFDAGLSLYQQGRMRDAAIEFLIAYGLAPHGDSLFNAGLALDAAGDSGGAATTFAWALELGMRAEAATEAKSRLERLGSRLGTLRVQAPPGAVVEVSPLKHKGSPVVFHALPGEILVTVTMADGGLISRRVRVRAKQQTLVVFAPPPTKPDASRGDPPESEPTPAADQHDAGTFPWRTAAWVSVGAGAVAAVGAVALRSATLGAKDDYDASGHTDRDAREHALSLNRWTNVALVSAAVLGAAGAGVLVFYKEPKSDLAIGAGPSSLQLSGRF